MATAKGVIQGYTAVAAVDGAHQVIVAASAHGSGSGQSTLLPTVAQTDAVRSPQTLITADAGYHSEANLKALYEQGIPALVADGLMRRRDERFKHQDKYKALADPLANKGAPDKTTELFGPKDFSYDADANTCICPAGQHLYSNGSHCVTNGRTHHKFTGTQGGCGPCKLRSQCLRYPERTLLQLTITPWAPDSDLVGKDWHLLLLSMGGTICKPWTSNWSSAESVQVRALKS